MRECGEGERLKRHEDFVGRGLVIYTCSPSRPFVCTKTRLSERFVKATLRRSREDAFLRRWHLDLMHSAGTISR